MACRCPPPGAGVRLALSSKAVLELEAAKAIQAPAALDCPLRLMINIRTSL